MSFRRGTSLAVAALGTALIATGCSGGGAGDAGGGGDAGGEVTLTVNLITTEEHPAAEAMKKWMEEVTERTDGAVQFEEYYNAALCEGTEAIDCVESGTADISMTPVGYNPTMELSQVGNVLSVTPNMQSSINAFNKLYIESDDFQAEYAERNQRLLYANSNSMPVLISSEEIDGLEGMAGKDIRAYDSMGRAVADMGANPVTHDPAELYESIQRGVITGSVFPLESVIDFRLTEVSKAIYDLGPYLGSYSINTWNINNDVWSTLSDDQQQVIDEVSQEVAGEYIDTWMVPGLKESCETARADGLEIEVLGPEPTGDAWAERVLESSRAAFVDSVAGATDDPAGFFDQYVAHVEEGDNSSQATSEICS